MTLPPHRSRWLCTLGAAALLSTGTAYAQSERGLPVANAPAIAQPAAHRELPPITARQHANAEAAYLAGAKHLRDSEFKEAENEFARAVVLDPTRNEYLAALTMAREHRVADLLQQAAQRRGTDPAAADKLLDQARAIDSANPRVVQHEAARQLAAVTTPLRHEQLASTIALQPNQTKHSYHERKDIRALAAEIAGNYGLRAALDPDLKTTPFRIDLDDVGYDDAMRVFNLLTKTIATPLDAHTFVLAEDSENNRKRYERLVEETFYLPGFSADQMKDFVSIAQSVFEIKQVSVQPTLNTLVVRGPADEMSAVERIFADLLQGGSDVVIDMKLYEVNKQHVQNLGIVLPQSINGFSLVSEAQSVISQNSSLISQLISSGVLPSTATTAQIAEYLVLVAGLGNSSLLTNSFLTIGGGATTAVLSTGNVPTLNLALTNSDARTLEDVQLRGSDRQTITFKVGTRYPIQTSLFSDIASSTNTSLSGLTVNGVSLSSLLSQYLGTSSVGSSAVIPQVQYEDLGLVVKAIPLIQRTSDVSMHLEIKISSLAGTALNGIPILGSRQFTSDLTMHDGETALLISNTTNQETSAVVGIPGLSELPGFQSTTNRNGSVVTGNLVLLITPHIVRHGHTSGRGPYIPLPTHSDDD